MKINICWLYYDLMNTYGDSGNLLSLIYRCQQRGIKTKINYFTVGSNISLLQTSDLFLMGGAEDRQQQIVAKDLVGKKKQLLKSKIEQQVPGLFICGAYQFLGEYYLTHAKQKLDCLNLAPLNTVSGKNGQSRLIGDIVVKVTHPTLSLNSNFQQNNNRYLIGFENHNGRTNLKNKKDALGQTILGYGNNDHDHFEGVVFYNSIGTYLHGPILPRNPALSDFLIEKALSIKYNQSISLKPINDHLEQKNRLWLLREFNVNN